MTFREVPFNLGHGGAHLNQSVLREILVELQDRVVDLQAQVSGNVSPGAFNQTVVSGAAVNTDIGVSGITTVETLMGVVKLDFTLTEGAPNTRAWDAEELLSESSVTSDGNIQLDSTDTSGAALLVTWLSR